jgi:hypothetical protein
LKNEILSKLYTVHRFNTLVYQKACPEISKAISIMPMESAMRFGYQRYWHYDSYSLSDSSLWSFGIDVLPHVAHVTPSIYDGRVCRNVSDSMTATDESSSKIYLTAPASAIG